ncbi:NAD(P)/FAD-dependent oxidoreductase [Noviherbaspirillum soli]|uniref:NAD(P)/FAD-dependent oxidoreductase n=1 Tax=Noviherbaspirillum soli TaxID=1064518 RepID=UPI001E5DF199|nr:NAD(P)/FAD-dependent oxidoreductase [Noviherbaspirillum soli]
MENTNMHTFQKQTDFEVVVVGGSYAGLSAALQLARARRNVLVIDAGRRRNRFALHSHGFLTQDGSEAAAIATQGRTQLRAYPNVAWANDIVASVTNDGGFFEVTLGDGGTVSARRLVLATGVTDTLPPIEGLAERWGRRVFHCPYCHGYELDDADIGVLATSELSMHHALLLPDWGRVTLFLNNAFTPTDAQSAALARRGVAIEATPVARLDGEADVVLADGRRLPMTGLFVVPRTTLTGELAQQLGCAVEAGPTGEFVVTDSMKATTVHGVFCCGDMARAAGNVALAVADGAMAGIATHRSLIAELDLAM